MKKKFLFIACLFLLYQEGIIAQNNVYSKSLTQAECAKIINSYAFSLKTHDKEWVQASEEEKSALRVSARSSCSTLSFSPRIPLAASPISFGLLARPCHAP